MIDTNEQLIRKVLKKYQRKYPHNWPTTQAERADRILAAVNCELEQFGVEPVRAENYQVDRYYYNIIALYVNTGNTYNLTLVYDTEAERFSITSWGDWFKSWERKHPSDWQ